MQTFKQYVLATIDKVPILDTSSTEFTLVTFCNEKSLFLVPELLILVQIASTIFWFKLPLELSSWIHLIPSVISVSSLLRY
jgi:hypothetical protein